MSVMLFWTEYITMVLELISEVRDHYGQVNEYPVRKGMNDSGFDCVYKCHVTSTGSKQVLQLNPVIGLGVIKSKRHSQEGHKNKI